MTQERDLGALARSIIDSNRDMLWRIGVAELWAAQSGHG